MSTPFVSLASLSKAVAAATLSLLSMDSSSPADLSKITLADLQTWLLANAAADSIDSSAVNGFSDVTDSIATINSALLDKVSGTYGYAKGTDYEGISLYWKNAIADYTPGRPLFTYKNQTTGDMSSSELVTTDEATTLLATKLDSSKVTWGTIKDGWYAQIGTLLLQSFTIGTTPGGTAYTFPKAFSAAPNVVASGRDAGADTNYPTIINPDAPTATGGNLYTVQNGGTASGPFDSGYSVVTVMAFGLA